MKLEIESLKKHQAWPELAAYAKTKRFLPDLEKVTEVELLGVMWAFVKEKNEMAASLFLDQVGFELDRIMFQNSGGN